MASPENSQPAATDPKMVFDRDAFRETLLGDEPLMLDIAGMYQTEGRRQLQELEAACRTRDASRVQAVAHSLKGASGSICARSMKEAALALEMAARSGNLDELGRLFPVLLERFEEVLEALDEAFQKPR
jgi:two-component system, sensor histidine kinase and response regulator